LKSNEKHKKTISNCRKSSNIIEIDAKPIFPIKHIQYMTSPIEHIMSRRAKVLTHKNSLASPLFLIEMTVPGQKSEM
jgi:hypothetical protein